MTEDDPIHFDPFGERVVKFAPFAKLDDQPPGTLFTFLSAPMGFIEWFPIANLVTPGTPRYRTDSWRIPDTPEIEEFISLRRPPREEA